MAEGVYSTTNCGGFCPSLLEYCFKLVEVEFISTLKVPLLVT